MAKLHSISTKVIPRHIFVNEFANFNPIIHILLFLDSAQNQFLMSLGNQEIVKKTSAHQISGNVNKCSHFNL